MSHIFIFIYCYGFCFGLIGYIKFQLFIRLYFMFCTFTNQNLLLFIKYHSFTQIWVCIVFPFYPFKASFSFQDQWHFSPLPPSTIVFSIKLINLLIVHKCDKSFGLLLTLAIQSQAFVFHHLAGDRVAAVHEVASPNKNEIWTAIHHRSFVPSRRLARGSVPEMIQYIYAPPQNLPRLGDATQIFPSQETPRRWRACACLSDPWLRGRGWRGVSWTYTLRHRDSNTP